MEAGDAGASVSGTQGAFRMLSEIEHIPTAYLGPVYVSKGYDIARRPEMSQAGAAGAEGVLEIAIAEVERLEIVLGMEAMELAERSGRWRGRGTEWTGETPYPAETGRLSYKGYLVAGDKLRPLPIGSTLDSRSGIFAWQPGPGFLGEYTFVFIRERSGGIQDKNIVRITIHPKFSLLWLLEVVDNMQIRA